MVDKGLTSLLAQSDLILCPGAIIIHVIHIVHKTPPIKKPLIFTGFLRHFFHIILKITML